MNVSADHAMRAARAVFDSRVLEPSPTRAALLLAIAAQLDADAAELVDTAHHETFLTSQRLRGELDRTVRQLELFADVVVEGSWVDARIDAGPPDMRRMLHPIGPVAVFAAGNFPLAFSVPGGDTASALAAGCPVVVKAHPGHPLTSRIAAAAIASALRDVGLPDAVVQVLEGDIALGEQLVDHPDTAAVGFTGSLHAGRLLFDRAAARPRPIPVYAEMGSVNPLFVLPGALRDRPSEIASGLAASVTLGVGQFCTQPGLVVGVGLRDFAGELARELARVEPAPMLTHGIGAAYTSRLGHLLDLTGVEVLTGRAAVGTPSCLVVDAVTFGAHPELSEEVFGPSTVVVTCHDVDELIGIAHGLDGQLTATVHADRDDDALARALLDVLRDRAGRIVWNGYPTGVAVTDAMQHGGPYPASTCSAHTSVGTTSVARWVRPVAYQAVPQAQLPLALRDDNPTGILRRLDGASSREPVPTNPR